MLRPNEPLYVLLSSGESLICRRVKRGLLSWEIHRMSERVNDKFGGHLPRAVTNASMYFVTMYLTLSREVCLGPSGGEPQEHAFPCANDDDEYCNRMKEQRH